jgi:hypothetical protein
MKSTFSNNFSLKGEMTPTISHSISFEVEGGILGLGAMKQQADVDVRLVTRISESLVLK